MLIAAAAAVRRRPLPPWGRMERRDGGGAEAAPVMTACSAPGGGGYAALSHADAAGRAVCGCRHRDPGAPSLRGALWEERAGDGGAVSTPGCCAAPPPAPKATRPCAATPQPPIAARPTTTQHCRSHTRNRPTHLSEHRTAPHPSVCRTPPSPRALPAPRAPPRPARPRSVPPRSPAPPHLRAPPAPGTRSARDSGAGLGVWGRGLDVGVASRRGRGSECDAEPPLGR